MTQTTFNRWVAQTIQDLKKHKKVLEEEKLLRILPLDERIQEVNRLISALEGEKPPVPSPDIDIDLFGAVPRKKPSSNKGYRYHGSHWTQRPENKAKVRANALKGALMRGKRNG